MSFAKAVDKRFNDVHKVSPSPTRYFQTQPTRIRKMPSLEEKGRKGSHNPMMKQPAMAPPHKLEIERLVLERQTADNENRALKMELEDKKREVERLQRELENVKASGTVQVVIKKTGRDKKIQVGEMNMNTMDVYVRE